MIILGIDPGIATTGYAILEGSGNSMRAVAYGHIQTLPTRTFFERMKEINTEIKSFLKTFRPECLAIEKIFFAKNTKTAINVAQMRGSVILEVLNHEVEVFEYAPNEVKMAVTGYGHADKQQIQKMVKSLLNLAEIPKPDDTADALAVAICHFNSAKYVTLQRRLK